MFTQKQFEFMCRCQWLDDWHASYFTTIVRQCHESEVDEFTTSVRLEQAEFDELMAILSRADQEDIFQLQCALNSLNLLPCTMFKPSA